MQAEIGAMLSRITLTLPNNKILHWSKLKAHTDDKINVTEKMKFVLERFENIVGKGENAGYHYVFKSLFSLGY